MTTVARTWTVTTWNLHGSAGPPLASVAARLRSFAPDVIALQEVQRRQAASLAETLGMQYHWALKHYPWTPLLKSKGEGVAILTPHALAYAMITARAASKTDSSSPPHITVSAPFSAPA